MGAFLEGFIGKVKAGTEYGIFVETYNTNGYPLICKIKLPKTYGSMFHNDVGSAFFLCRVTNLEIETTNIAGNAFGGLYYLANTAKIKLKVTSIASNGMSCIGENSKKSCKFWIANSCTSIASSVFGTTNELAHKIYCEAESKPSGWNSNWALIKAGLNHTVTWGVTEEQFDAL